MPSFETKFVKSVNHIREPLSWNPTLLEIKSLIEPIAGVEFNAVLLNLYRNGLDSVGWHWGKRVSINRLREIANVNRDGASLKGLVTAGRKYRFFYSSC